MGVHNRQPLAKDKGVRREEESEGSLRQNPAPSNTNLIRHNRWDETAKQVKVLRLCGHRSVNVAEKWDEGYLFYHWRSHGRVETEYEARRKASHERSAEAIVPHNDLKWEGHNLNVLAVKESYQDEGRKAENL